MRWKLVDGAQLSGESSTYVVALDIGDEAVASLTAMAKEHELSNAQITAVGAFDGAVVGWFDRDTKSYRRIPVQEQCEVLSLVGDIVGSEYGPQLHLHAVLGLSDGSTRGGHLLEGLVWPTLEVVIPRITGRLAQDRSAGDRPRPDRHRSVPRLMVILCHSIGARH